MPFLPFVKCNRPCQWLRMPWAWAIHVFAINIILIMGNCDNYWAYSRPWHWMPQNCDCTIAIFIIAYKYQCINQTDKILCVAVIYNGQELGGFMIIIITMYYHYYCEFFICMHCLIQNVMQYIDGSTFLQANSILNPFVIIHFLSFQRTLSIMRGHWDFMNEKKCNKFFNFFKFLFYVHLQIEYHFAVTWPSWCDMHCMF